MTEHVLSIVLLVPLVGAIACALVPSARTELIRWVAMLSAVGGLVLVVPLWMLFERGTTGYQFVTETPWIPQFGITLRLGVDGISLLLVLLTLILLPLVFLASWQTIGKRVKEYHVLLLLLQVAMIGVFCALDGFLFYVLWEAMLVPMYFLIGAWGGPNRLRAAVKFFLYTVFGSVLMLVALLQVYHLAGGSFDIRVWQDLSVPASQQGWIFLALFVGFAIKVPMVPFHTWLPEAHGEAPTGGSVILAGVLLKMGTYGFVRFSIPILPEATMQWMPVLVGLAVVGVVYGALTAMAQTDMKQLVAYSSVSHLGLVMLGVFCVNPNGLSGGLLQMLNHGLSTGALFLLVGMLYERRHTKRIADFGGIAGVMPLHATLFLLISMASIGLPLLNGFVGEFLILAGAAELVLAGWPGIAVLVLAASGLILGAAYMLWMVRRVMFGPVVHEENKSLQDIRPFGLEFWSVVPLVALCVWIGLHPRPILEILEPPVRALVAEARPGYFDAPAVATVMTSVPVDVGAPTAEHAGAASHAPAGEHGEAEH